jgi:FAD/FMN-containing dehydrogenase
MAALCALPDYEAVKRLLGAARRGLGPQLSAFEVMWPDYWQLVTGRMGVRAPVSSGHGHYVLVEAQGTDAAIDAPRFENWLEQLSEGGVLVDAALAQSIADIQSFWALRDACAEFIPTIGPHISYDVGLAVRDMDAFAAHCKATLAQAIPGCESVYYGHIGDGNLHLVAWVPGLGVQAQPKHRMDEAVYGTVRDFKGSISAEHGIGTTKKAYLGHARSEAEIALMRTLKAALDPAGLLNPGKVI